LNPLANPKTTILEGQKSTLTSMKVYGDFKRLDEFIRSTGLTKDDTRMEVLPELPSKLY